MTQLDYTSPALQNPGTPVYDPTILNYATGKHAASDMQSSLTRATWDDYVKRFQPQSDALVASTGYMNPNLYTTQVQSGVGQVNKAYDTALGSQATSLSRLGLSQTGEQQAYSNMQNNVNRSASVVDAANRIRQRIAARDQAIALGGSGS